MKRVLPSIIMMETTTDKDQENMNALKIFRIGMTKEGYPYGTWQTMEAVNIQHQGVSEKDQNMEHSNSKFF